jgi:hypothetical protein
MSVNVEVETYSLLFGKLFDHSRLWVQSFVGRRPKHPVDVQPRKRTPVVASDHSVRVQYRNDLENNPLSQQSSLLGL